MKKSVFILFAIFLFSCLTIESCGPVVFTTRLGHTPPHWFYPNRIETVRYIYFPDYTIYYDLSSRNYSYIENGLWITVDMLPPRFNSYNLRRSKQVRINNYYDDNIQRYHNNKRLPNTRNSVKRRK